MRFTLTWLVAIALAMGGFFMLLPRPPIPVKPKEVPIYGQVTAKEWIPGYTDTWFMTTWVGNIPVMTPMVNHFPDRYHLKVSGQAVYVTKEVFEKTTIGDMYGTPP